MANAAILALNLTQPPLLQATETVKPGDAPTTLAAALAQALANAVGRELPPTLAAALSQAGAGSAEAPGAGTLAATLAQAAGQSAETAGTAALAAALALALQDGSGAANLLTTLATLAQAPGLSAEVAYAVTQSVLFLLTQYPGTFGELANPPALAATGALATESPPAGDRAATSTATLAQSTGQSGEFPGAMVLTQVLIEYLTLVFAGDRPPTLAAALALATADASGRDLPEVTTGTLAQSFGSPGGPDAPASLSAAFPGPTAMDTGQDRLVALAASGALPLAPSSEFPALPALLATLAQVAGKTGERDAAVRFGLLLLMYPELGQPPGDRPPLVSVAQSRLASTVIDQFVRNVSLILSGTQNGGRFLQAGYRHTLEVYDRGGINGMYHVECTGARQARPFWGGTDAVRELDVVIRVAYWRIADRRRSNRDAAADMARIGDLCESPAGYAFQDVGIRSVKLVSANRATNTEHLEVWEAKFTVEWEQPFVWVVTPDTTQAAPVGGGFMFTVATLAALGTYPVLGMLSGAWLAFVEETQRQYRLRAYTGTASNGVSLISAPDGRQWVVI